MVEQTLISTYIKWAQDPQKYNEEMAIIIDKIIFNVIHRKGKTIYTIWDLEDKEDVIQDIRITLFQKLKKVKNPTNKRLYNFLTSHVNWALALKRRQLKKKIIKENKLDKVTEEVNSNYFFFNGTETMNDIAGLLIEGYTATEVKQILGLNNNSYKENIEKIKTELLNGELA